MIEIKNKQIVIDGIPRLIMCGEIHYFRLQRDEWPDRVQKLRDAGCNAVASYVPWLCHEPVEGQIRIRVAAATVNPADTAVWSGFYAESPTVPEPVVAGLELAGVVDAVGPGSMWNVGDRVAAATGGAHA